MASKYVHIKLQSSLDSLRTVSYFYLIQQHFHIVHNNLIN